MSLQPGAMPERADYRLPVLLMAMMLGCVILLVTVYPARTYKLDDPGANSYLYEQDSEYRQRQPYTDLQWYGRAVYKAEGCFYCHSQQARYQDRGMGPSMIPQEYQFDAPHLLGSARTGPDLAREGGKYPSRWHREHHINPRSKYAGSIMPSFRHLDEQELPMQEDGEIDAEALLRATPEELLARIDNDTDERLTAAETILELRLIGYTDHDLKKPDGRGVTRLDALTAYLQSLGPQRLYEPWKPNGRPADVDRLAQVVNQRLPRNERYRLSVAAGRPIDPADPRQPASTPAAEGALPPGVAAPADWTGLAESFAEYWVPSEYQDLAKEAKENNKIPAFEPRFIVNGRGIYLDKCAHCHGLNGQGNGPAGRYMEKKPANFWLPQFKQYSDAMWFYRIAEGVPGTQMPVWKLSLRQRKHQQEWDQIWYLVTYLKYIAAASPMQPVPYDVPPEYYLFRQDKARDVTYPVDEAFIRQHAESLAKPATDSAPSGTAAEPSAPVQADNP